MRITVIITMKQQRMKNQNQNKHKKLYQINNVLSY